MSATFSKTTRSFEVVERSLDDQNVYAARFAMIFDLFDCAVEMVRQNERRRNPSATVEELEAAVGRWLLERPGAELGDADGRPVPWPRVR